MKKIINSCSAVIMMIAVLLSGTSFGQDQKLTDPEIASVSVAANQVDINYAKLAREKSKNKDILNFASTMIADHQSVIDQASALVKKLGVTPKDNAISQKLNADAVATKQKLSALTGDSFDKAYVNNEVEYHNKVIETVRNVLIPQSQNAELKALLENVLPVLETHLSHAEMLQKAF